MNDQRRQAAIEAGARALAPGSWEDEHWRSTAEQARSQALARYAAAAVIDAALPHLAPDVETIAATLALAYGGHVSPPRGGRDWKAAEAVHALLVPVDAP